MKLKLRTKILIMCLCCTYGVLLIQTILFANAYTTAMAAIVISVLPIGERINYAKNLKLIFAWGYERNVSY